MNSTAPHEAWSRPPEQLNQMAQMNNDLDDLSNLFEFGDIDLNPITSIDSGHYGDPIQHPGTHPNTPFDEINEAQAISGSSAQDFGSHNQFGISQNGEQQQHHFDGATQSSHPYSQDPMYQSTMQAQQQQPYYANQQFPFQGLQGFPPNQVPPTPNSFGMHGEQGPFMQQQMDPQQRAILEQRYHMSKDNSIALTPMASPAGTPQYNVQPEFTIPGAYFSPLTSPILPPQNGQNGAHHQQGYYTNPSTAPSSNATSPLDPNADVDMMGDEIESSQARKSKKSNRKKASAPRSAGPLARVKESPIQKAIKRKSGTMLSSLAPTRENDSAPPRSSSAQPRSAGLQLPRNDSSENGSISPEPLSEALMGPPPRPGSSLNQSPALPGRQQDASSSLGKAATPKSLLSRRSDQQRSSNQRTSQQQADGTDNDQMEFEELQLPAAAADDSTSRPPLPQIDTQIQQPASNDDTPRLSARKTPKLGPSSTPSSARPPSSMASPSITGSPMTASTPGALLKDRKQDPKAARANKKRGSMSGTGSALVSPALRPKISPSIKPLLPEGASLHSPTHALLLASKSNYQNLLEGNHLPGVNYPDSLSTGLTSKRTSHKVAEQGRRNRINEALKEMQALLPKAASKKESSDGSPEAMVDGDAKDSKEDAVKSNSSKAATVESANDYIRRLQKENAALLMIKKEHEEMKKKLDEQTNSAPSTERSSSAVGSTSPAPAA